MRLRLTRHPVHGPGALSRVLTPRRPLRNLWVRTPAFDGVGLITGSRADLLWLGALIRFAAISGHSAVYLPLVANALPADIPFWLRDGDSRPVDLLIARSDVGLRPSAWPRVRRRIAKGPVHGCPVTVDTPAPRPVRHPEPWEPHSVVSLATHGGTLMMRGSARAFQLAGDTVTAAGEALASTREIHRHGEAVLSVVDCASETGSVELLIQGRDPIFHRRRWADRHPGGEGGGAHPRRGPRLCRSTRGRAGVVRLR